MPQLQKYPDLFTHRTVSFLPKEAQKSVHKLGKCFKQQTLTVEYIAAFRDTFKTVPAQSIARATSDIREIGGLYQGYEHQTPSGAASNFLAKLARKRNNVDKTLAKHPDMGWFLMNHGNGFTRQAAIEALDTPPQSSFEVAAIVYRLNDWVENVRSASAIYAAKHLPSTAPAVLAQSAFFILPQLGHLTRWSEDAPQAIRANFQRPDVLTVLKDEFLTAREGKVGQCLRQVLRHHGLDQYLEDLAQHAQTPTVRAIAVETLLMQRAKWFTTYRQEWVDKVYGITRRVAEFETRELTLSHTPLNTLHFAAKDKSSQVRRIAADFLIQHRNHLTPQMNAVMETLAKDKNKAVRARIAFITQS